MYDANRKTSEFLSESRRKLLVDSSESANVDDSILKKTMDQDTLAKSIEDGMRARDHS